MRLQRLEPPIALHRVQVMPGENVVYAVSGPNQHLVDVQLWAADRGYQALPDVPFQAEHLTGLLPAPGVALSSIMDGGCGLYVLLPPDDHERQIEFKLRWE